VQERCSCVEQTNSALEAGGRQYSSFEAFLVHTARCNTLHTLMTMNRLRTVPPRRVESVSSSAPERAWSPRRVLLAVRALLAILVWAAPSPTTGTLFLLFSLGATMAKELPSRRWRRPRRRESVPPIPTAAVDAYFTVTERGAPCFAGG
jgi:hypothetical protein